MGTRADPLPIRARMMREPVDRLGSASACPPSRLLLGGSRGTLGAILGVFVLAATTSGAHAGGALDDCLPSQVRLSAVRVQNAFTGGAYPISIVLRNISKRECSIKGHPQVVVAPKRFPVVVGDVADFDRNDPLAGPERLLHVRPGHRVSAQVIVGRPCDGSKSEMTTTTVMFAAVEKQVEEQVTACRRQGVVLYTGPFMTTR